MSVNRQTGSLEYRRELKKMFDLQKFGMKFGLDNMRAILKKLGNPHEGLRFVHLAGTNGKGSVGAMLRSILMETGGRIGFYASPHLATFRERITINGDMINEEETLKLSRRVWSACDPEAPPTFFEFVTAMAFLYFKNSAAELAVIEAGLGGRLDSTNVIKPLLSIITNVSLEHTAQLGDTVAAIAAEKAGIIKPAVPLVAGRLDREAHEEIMRAAD
ncbi:MAG: bifunctional folylpolyglutamate synthase/dihydrofolate synthase, partial [Candidatus Adiutrix sp.]|nr:bifunctional folylpolyglutamate synthase/dihydrofolate synthase [Candidatus Adiutrix sp.]